MREAVFLAGLGAAVGAPVALALTGLIKSQLFGVQPDDPLTFISASMLMVAVAVLAAWIPARQASRVAPALALKSE